MERLRKAVEVMSIEHSGDHELSVTVSVGVTAYDKEADNGELLVKQADDALYADIDVCANTWTFM